MHRNIAKAIDDVTQVRKRFTHRNLKPRDVNSNEKINKHSSQNRS